MFSKDVFAERVREYRLMLGLTQQALGDLAGLSKQAINDIEAGRRLTTLDKAVALANTFNVSLDWLVGRENSDSSPKPAKDPQAVLLLEQTSELLAAVRGYLSKQ